MTMSLGSGVLETSEDLLLLRVVLTEPVAEGIQLFDLRHREFNELPPFTPGSHIGVEVPGGAMRSYSLCNDPRERDRYVIAVKREPQGRGGSVALVDHMRQGDAVRITPPRNVFELVTTAPSYIFVAGGIGITPILSMIHALRADPDKPFHLYYLTRSRAATAF